MTAPAPNQFPDLNRWVGALSERKAGLHLNTLDLCFLVLLHVRAKQHALASFSEQQLADAFEQACDAVEPGAENLTSRANHAIRRLREQRLLVRVDGAGVVRAGEFMLSRLALGIAEFFIEDDVLTTENLSLLMRTIASALSEVLAGARRSSAAGEEGPNATAAERETTVVQSLRITVRELLGAVERRQRGLDQQQEAFQTEISQMLTSDWFGSIEKCQKLLDASAGTLREINEILLRDCHHLSTLLIELGDVCSSFGAEAAESEVAHVAADVERIAAWGALRQRAWSDYYEYVHRYLRDVVRLDPARALTFRLREQLANHGNRSFALVVAAPLAIRCVRDVQPVVEPPPVQRPRKVREPELEVSEIQEDPMKALERRVLQELEGGSLQLSEVTARILAQYPEKERFMVAGRVADIVARLAKIRGARERPWVEVDASLAIEQRGVRNATTATSESVSESGTSGEIDTIEPEKSVTSADDAAPELAQLNWGFS